MAKSLVLGNGSLLACFDKHGQLSDFYFPHIGLENHISTGLTHKVGVFVDGTLYWLSDPGWESTVAYQKDTLASSITANHPGIKIKLTFNDVVYNEHSIFIRKVTVHNAGPGREIKLFFNQQFHISENPRGDTAYFSPADHALVHYKGRRVFIVSARTGKDFFDDFGVGLLGIEGKEGTWRDAEDGVLSKCAVEHGSVDSVMGITLSIEHNKDAVVWQWIAAAETYRDAIVYHRDIISRGPDHLLESTVDYWNAWINKREFVFYGLDEKVVDLFKKSLLVIRTHFDKAGGIIASSDSDILQYGRDTYAYVWPRDAAYVAFALDRAGYEEMSERFFNFCADALTNDGYLLHKYRPDSSLGSSWHPWAFEGKTRLPIQEDETAIVLFSMWENYKVSRNLEFVESMYNELIKKAADFLVRHRDKTTELPLPSYDLWEEQWGISCYTAASVYGGLTAAAQFAELLGKHVAAERYRATATKTKEAILAYFYNEKEGHFAKMLHQKGDTIEQDMTVDASSAYGLLRFGVLPADDPRLVKAFTIAERRLSPPGKIGGIARYEGDRYYRVTDNAPGNPWFIPTFWHIEYHIAKAKSEEDLKPVKERLKWACDFAVGAGMLSEQIHPENGTPLSVCPLVWSHAAYVLAVVAYLEKLETLGICKNCYPVGKGE